MLFATVQVPPKRLLGERLKEFTAEARRTQRKPIAVMLVDFAEHAAPARARGEVQERLADAAKGAEKAAVGVVAGGGLHGPVNDHGAAHDGVAVNEAPVAAVEAAVAIVTHDEVVVFGDDEFAIVHALQNRFRPFGADTDLHEIWFGGREIIAKGVAAGRVVDDIGLREQRAVDIHVLIDDAETFAGKADDTFDIVEMVVEGKFEDYDVAAMDGTIGEKFLIPCPAAFENEFIDQHVITDQ